MQYGDNWNGIKRTGVSADTWTPPPSGFFKLNFDGDSKGNLGPSEYGCIIKDHMRNMQGFKCGFIGKETNNAAEVEGLLQGIQMAKEYNWTPLIVEVDSQMVIQMETKIR